MIATSLNFLEFHKPYLRFLGLVGCATWSDRLKQVHQAIAGNIYAKEHLEAENELCFRLEELAHIWERSGRFPLTLRKKRHLFFTMAFIAQTVSLFDAVDEASGRQLIRRIVGAIKNNPEDVRALQVELATATHFLKNGHKVTFPDLNGDERFDLLLHEFGGRDVEIECKFISTDKGKKIHRADLPDFYKMIAPFLIAYISTSSSDLIVELTVPDRFPSSMEEKKIISDILCAAVKSNVPVSVEGVARIDIKEAALTDLIFAADGVRLNRKRADEASGTKNRPMLLLGKKGGRTILVVVKSDKNDSVYQSIYRTLTHAASRQLTGVRPALLVARLQDIDIEALVRVAAKDFGSEPPPNMLQVIASRLIRGRHHEQVVSIVFLSESEIGARTADRTPSSGAAYYFDNKTSPFWGAGFNFHFVSVD